MSLDQIVNINITRETKTVSRQGFGTQLILGPNATFSEKLRYYTSLASVADDFLTSDEEYIAATRAFGQPLKPKKIAIGKQSTAVAQVITFTPVVANNALYSVTLNGVLFSYTSDGSATDLEIVAGLISAINGGSEPVTASGTSTLILTADQAGIAFTATGTVNLTKVLTTPNNGVVEDLIAIQDESDDWYALAMISRNNAEILVAAAWIETQKKIFLACTDDAAVLTSSTTDIASKLKALNYARTAYLYSGDQDQYPECAWLGGQLPETPGSNTYKFKTLVGIAADNLTPTQEQNAKGKNANVFTPVGGVDITSEGTMAEGEFIDIIIGIDWIHSNMQADIYQALVNEKKIPYTDNGVAVITSIIGNRLQLAVKASILAETPAFEVSAPLVADIATSDKAARLLPDVSFSATVAGAIHAVEITGTVGV